MNFEICLQSSAAAIGDRGRKKYKYLNMSGTKKAFQMKLKGFHTIFKELLVVKFENLAYITFKFQLRHMMTSQTLRFIFKQLFR